MTLAGHPDVSAVVIADIAPDRAEALAATPGTRAAPSLEALLGDVQAVVIAAATSAHAEPIERAVEAGLPAFCERPIALDLESTRAVIERVRGAGVPVQMGFQRRSDPGYRAAAAAVAGGALGTLYLIRTGCTTQNPHTRPTSRNRAASFGISPCTTSMRLASSRPRR